MKCNGYERGYVGRSNPDANMQKIVNVNQAQLLAYQACRYTQNDYSATYPMLHANAGTNMVIAYTPNGHTMWMKPPPPNGPRNFTVRWTGTAGTQMYTIQDVLNAPILLNVQFDTPCHSWVDGSQLDPSAGICHTSVTIPPNTPSGLYQFVWYWPFRYAGDNVIEDYTSCWDVQVTGVAQPQTTTSSSTASTSSTTSAATSSTSSTTSSTSGSTTGNDYSTTAPSESTTTTTTTGSVAPVSNYLTPTDDSYVKGGAFSSMNYDYYNLMVEGGSENNQIMESYIRFNVSAFGTNIGALQLYLTNVDPSSTLSMFVSVCDDNGWTETSITWDTKPNSCSDAVGKVSADGIANIDASVAIQSITDGTITIKLWNPPTSTQIMSVYSKNNGDSSQVPLLYVAGGAPAEMGASTTTGGASSLVASVAVIVSMLAALMF